MNPRVLIALFSLLLVPPSNAAGQTLEMIAADVLRADSLHDWRRLLALAHPEALRAYRERQVRMAGLERFTPMAEALDSCALSQFRLYSRFLLDSVYRVPTVDSLSRLRPDTLFARVQRFAGRLHAADDDEDLMRPQISILGHVLAEGDSIAYVVLEYRHKTLPFPDWPERRAEIMTFRRLGAAWRSMLDNGLGDDIGNVGFGRESCP